jgi:hypothetical protein
MQKLESRDNTLVRFVNGSLWSFDHQRIALAEALAEFDDLIFQFGKGRWSMMERRFKQIRFLFLRLDLWYI